MVTILSNALGRGRCDARCYNAKGSKCDCICGGAHHGRGLSGAIEAAREHLTSAQLHRIERESRLPPRERRKKAKADSQGELF